MSQQDFCARATRHELFFFLLLLLFSLAWRLQFASLIELARKNSTFVLYCQKSAI